MGRSIIADLLRDLYSQAMSFIVLVCRLKYISMSMDTLLFTCTYEPRHEISNNVVCATSEAPD